MSERQFKTWKTVKKKKAYMETLMEVLRADGRVRPWAGKTDGRINCGWSVPEEREVKQIGSAVIYKYTHWSHYRYDIPLELARLCHDDVDAMRRLLETEIAIRTVRSA